MSTPFDPTNESAKQSDESLLKKHVPETESAGGPSTGSVLLVLFAFLLAAGAMYLSQYSGAYSVSSYNEEAVAGPAAPSGPKTVDMVAFGKKQYQSQCVTCHQATGLGTPGVYPPLAGSEWVLGSEERLVRIVLHGLSGPVDVKGVTYSGAVQMPAFGQVPNSGFNWRDDQIAAVLTYIRQDWGNSAPAVTKEKVAEIRQKQVRDKPWTIPELLDATK